MKLESYTGQLAIHARWPPRTLNLPSTFKEISDPGKTWTYRIILSTKTVSPWRASSQRFDIAARMFDSKAVAHFEGRSERTDVDRQCTFYKNKACSLTGSSGHLKVAAWSLDSS